MVMYQSDPMYMSVKNFHEVKFSLYTIFFVVTIEKPEDKSTTATKNSVPKKERMDVDE